MASRRNDLPVALFCLALLCHSGSSSIWTLDNVLDGELSEGGMWAAGDAPFDAAAYAPTVSFDLQVSVISNGDPHLQNVTVHTAFYPASVRDKVGVQLEITTVVKGGAVNKKTQLQFCCKPATMGLTEPCAPGGLAFTRGIAAAGDSLARPQVYRQANRPACRP